MSLRTSGLRVAGQESDIVDFISPSSKAPQSSPSLQGKPMYEDSESIRTWIDAIYCADESIFKLVDPDNADIFEFSTHPFRTHGPYSPLSDEFDSDSSASICFDASTWMPEVAESYDDDSDESDSTSSLPDEAQYITIPSDSPWYRPPSPSPGPISADAFGTGTYPDSCSSEVRQAIAQQELLLAVYYEELRRIVPDDDGAEYDFDWLDEVDPDLVLAPTETYADLCWESVVSEKSPTLRLGKPLADVPIGFGDVHGAF